MILDRGKIPLEGHVTALSYTDLAAYCYNDAEARADLTRMIRRSFSNRNRPIKDQLRTPRRSFTTGSNGMGEGYDVQGTPDRGYNHPPTRRHSQVKGEASTKAIIRGKKYKGGW